MTEYDDHKCHSDIPFQDYTMNIRNHSLSVTHHPGRPDMRSCPVGRQTRAESLKGEEQDSTCSGQPRKRIAVACGRCRKRKIRCSGEARNGQPCQNCKAAGANVCKFHRVGSNEVHDIVPTNTPPNSLGHLYPAVSYISDAVYGSVYSPCRPAAHSAYSCKSMYPSGWHHYPHPYSDEPEVDTCITSPSCVPNSEYVAGNYSCMPNSRGWNTALHMPVANNTIMYDQDPETGYQSPPISAYVGPSVTKTTVTSGEGHSLLSMIPLQISLPTANGDRQLPMPNTIRSSLTPAIDSFQLSRAPGQVHNARRDTNSPLAPRDATRSWPVESMARRDSARAGSFSGMVPSEAGDQLSGPRYGSSSEACSTMTYGALPNTSPEVMSPPSSFSYVPNPGTISATYTMPYESGPSGPSPMSTGSLLIKHDSTTSIYGLTSDGGDSSCSMRTEDATMYQAQPTHTIRRGPMAERKSIR